MISTRYGNTPGPTAGTHRPILGASRQAQRGNPWGNPCPSCGAGRYERCHKGTHNDDGKFIWISDGKCSRRVTWYPYGTPDDNELEGDDE